MNKAIKYTGGTLLVSLVILLLYSVKQRKNDNPRVFYKDRLPFGFNGFVIPAIGIFIKKDHKDSDHLLRHELVHWQQYQREGMIPFLYNYTKEQLKNGYDANPYEIEARYEESEYCKNNYTECVRKGDALTVYNPNFRNNR